MTVNGVRPDAKGNVDVDLPGIEELNGKVARLGDAVSEENQRAVGAEDDLRSRIAAETSRARTAEQGLRSDVLSANVAIADRYTKSETDAKIAEAVPDDYDEVKGRVAAVEAKVPAQATAQNQLADKAFVNSSIATNTAFYISDGGRPFQSLADLETYEGALTNNDYAFVVGRDAAGNTTYTRYKWNEATEAWAEEYVLNNSSFTAVQWEAISSGITSGLVEKLGALPTAEELAAAFAGKQVKLVVPGGGTRWVLSTESTGEAMEAFMADADSYTVTESYNGYWNYSLTGYDESAYISIVSLDLEKKDVVLFPIKSASSGEKLGDVVATRTAVDAEVPAQVDTTPAKDSVKLATSGGIWSAIWGALKSLPTGFASLYDWCKDQLSGKLNRTEAIEGFTEWEATSLPAGHVLDRCIYKGNSLWEVYLSIPDPGPGPVPVPAVYLAPGGPDATTLSGGDIQLTRTKIRPTNTSELLNDGNGVRPFALSAGPSRTSNLAALDANGNPTDSGIAKSVVESMLFAKYYPDGNVKSAAEFTSGIKYDAPDTTYRTITVRPFRVGTAGTATVDIGLEGRVVIPPFVDRQGNPYISDDGTRFKVVGVSNGVGSADNTALTAIVAPNTVTTIGAAAFSECTSLASVSFPAVTTIGGFAFESCAALTSISLPAATSIGGYAFISCTNLTSVSLPSATTVRQAAFVGCRSLTSVSLPSATIIGDSAFGQCRSLTSVSLPAATTIEGGAFSECYSLTSISLPAATSIGGYAFQADPLESVDFGDTPRPDVPSLLGSTNNAFENVPATCKIIVPYTQFDEWKAADRWRDLPQEFVRHAEKADKPATFTTGNLAEFDSHGNPTDSGIVKTNLSGSSVKLGAGASIGYSGSSDPLSVAIGHGAKVQSSSPNSVAIGNGAEAGTQSAGDTGSATAIGNTAKASAKSSVAIGSGANVTATAAVQIGYSATANTEEKSLRFRDTTVVNGNGKIPSASLDVKVVTKDELSGYVPTNRTVNGKSLSSDVTLTGADILVDTTSGAQKINAALAGKLASTSAASGWVSGTAYTVNALVTYDGVVYRCKANTVSPHTATPNTDTTHWEAKPVSDLFLPLTGGMMTGDIGILTSYGIVFSYGDADAIKLEIGYLDGVQVPMVGSRFLAYLDALPYSLATPTVINTASSEVVEGETVTYGAATLADRKANRVSVTAEVAELRLTFPAAVSGKVRDFGLRVEVGDGTAARAAPVIVPVTPTGETIKLESADGTLPALADGTATAKGVTLLHFSETAPGVFFVKGEQVKEI